MLRITQNISAKSAKTYYTTSDYYLDGQELPGVWHGRAARQLGLYGEIAKSDWEAMCDNLQPRTGERLTQRQNADRRVAYDFNFSPPKSVSTLYAITGDNRIVDAFRESVNETMLDIETEMKTRVRAGGRNEDRTTGNMAWGEYVHFTSRPVDGIPDPQLHAHCVVFNATRDHKEDRWKAAQFGDIKRDAPYFDALFHMRLASRLTDFGLDIERSKKSWEIGGIPKAANDAFSRRTALIEKLAKKKGITDPEEKAKLGAKTREAKNEHATFSQLQDIWRSQLEVADIEAIKSVARQIGTKHEGVEPLPAARAAVDYAIGHWFERNSVVPERRVLADAFRHAVGQSTAQTVIEELARRNLINGDRDGRRVVTTREILAEETRMLDFARSGRGTCAPLGNGKPHHFKNEQLNADQRKAVAHVLESPDRVLVVRGAAGTGKTWMLKEAADAIESGGKRVFAFAPSADASRGVLRNEAGFADADTVARLLADRNLQAAIENQVVWVDEAGLLGTRTMAQLFELARESGARLVLSGDRRQHGSVERGAALRLLEEEAGIIPAEIRIIKRQTGEYERAVRAISQGRVEDGFKTLDRLKWIKEVDDSERYKVMAADYVKAISHAKTALVVSPTHAEGARITGEIRSALKELGVVAGEERVFGTLEKQPLTRAERSDPVNYVPGEDVLVFTQNAKGYRRGQRLEVNDLAALPLDQAARFEVFHRGSLSLAAGDTIRITANGFTMDRLHRLNNGAMYEVDGFTPNGDIRLQNGWVVGKEFGHLAYGYTVTSHASQGRSVDHVLVGQSSLSFPASNREQFYVSVSRGKKAVTLYTDDKEALLEAVKRSDERLSATELVGDAAPHRQMPMLRSVPALPNHMPSLSVNEHDREAVRG